MTVRCLSDLALEEYLLEGDASRHAAHASTCSSCRARLARMEEEGREFLRRVYPRTVASIEAAADPRPRWKRWPVLLVPAAAALAALLLIPRPVVAPQGEDADVTQLKGGSPLELTVFLGTADGARQLADGATVPSTSTLRFQVRPSTACRVWIVSIDAGGGVSRLYPASGEGGAEIRAKAVLPGGAVLDGSAGPERFFVFCSRKPLDYGTVEQAVRRAVTRGEAAVRSVTAIPGLPEGTAQHSVLVEKT